MANLHNDIQKSANQKHNKNVRTAVRFDDTSNPLENWRVLAINNRGAQVWGAPTSVAWPLRTPNTRKDAPGERPWDVTLVWFIELYPLQRGQPSSHSKWGYNLYKWPYKWGNGIITPISGVISLLISGSRAHLVLFKLVVKSHGSPSGGPRRWHASNFLKAMSSCSSAGAVLAMTCKCNKNLVKNDQFPINFEPNDISQPLRKVQWFIKKNPGFPI